MKKLGHKVSYFILPVIIPFQALIILSFLPHFETLFQILFEFIHYKILIKHIRNTFRIIIHLLVINVTIKIFPYQISLKMWTS